MASVFVLSKGWIEVSGMVRFGDFTFPHVLGVQITNTHEEIERTVPGRTVAYRVDKAELGRTIKLTGEIGETDTDIVRSTIDEIRAFVDGAARSLDLEDGTTPFNALLADPEYTLEEWYENTRFSAVGRFYVPYTLTFLEVA
jgi:hypothetical protein